MGFYNKNEKRDEGKPVIGKPGAAFKRPSIFGKTPAFSKAAGSIRDRLKNLSKKDLAFVVVGIGVLIMAPVAEYLMSKPAGADQLMPGFGQRSEGSGSIYEPGIDSLSQGSPDGSGEVITPLSSRDPSSLIIGFQQPQPPAAPQTSSPPKTDFRDSMKETARTAFTEASKAAGAPTVIPKIQSSLRGVGSFFSGGEGSRTAGALSGGKILDNAKGASGKAASRSMVGPVATAGYKGVSPIVPNSSSRDAFEKLRGAASRAAGNFNGASAIRSLDKAAADSVEIGKGMGGLGSGSESEKTRAASGSSIRDTRNNSGETLAQMAQRMRMQKALEWEFYKQYEIPKMILTAMLGGFNGVLTDWTKNTTSTLLGMNPSAPPPFLCWVLAKPLQPEDSTLDNELLCNKYGTVGKKITVMKDKDGKPTFPPGMEKMCRCGIGPDPWAGAVVPKPAVPAAPAVPAGNSDPAAPVTAPTQTPVAVPVNYGNDLAAYDSALIVMAGDTLAGDAAADPKTLLVSAKAVAGGMAKCSAVAQTLYANIQSQAPKAAGAEMQIYTDSLSQAGTEAAIAREKYKAFLNRLDGEIARLENGGKTVIGGKEVLKIGDTDTLAVFKEIRSNAGYIEQNGITAFEKKLRFHESAAGFYNEQSGNVTGRAAGALKDVSAKLSELDGISEKLDAVKEDSITPDDVAAIKESFLKLTGKTAPSVNAPAANPQPAQGEAEGAAAPVPLLTLAMAWRGADEVKLWKEARIDDSLVKNTENENWRNLSPYMRLEAGKTDEDLASGGVPAADFVTLAIRGMGALPFDIKGSNGYAAQLSVGIAALDSYLTDWKARLKQAGVDFDQPPPVPPLEEVRTKQPVRPVQPQKPVQTL